MGGWGDGEMGRWGDGGMGGSWVEECNPTQINHSQQLLTEVSNFNSR